MRIPKEPRYSIPTHRRYTMRIVTGGIPTETAHRYTQVLEARLFCMDAEIQRPGTASCGVQEMPLYPRTVN